MTELFQLINNFGFPIVVCVLLLTIHKQTLKQLEALIKTQNTILERHQNDHEEIKELLKYNAKNKDKLDYLLERRNNEK